MGGESLIPEGDNWQESLRRYRQELARFSGRTRKVNELIKRAARADSDPSVALELLAVAKGYAGGMIPAFPELERWANYWQKRQEEVAIEFKARLQELLGEVER